MKHFILAVICPLMLLSCSKNSSDNFTASPPDTTTPTSPVAHDIYVAGNDYTTGANNTMVPTAKLWKNGVATALTTPPQRGAAHSVFVSGNDVYVAGEIRSGNYDLPVVWKNGVPLTLSYNANNDSHCYAVAVSGTDVYVAGTVGVNGINTARLWKNSVAVNLSVGTGDSYAYAVVVQGTDVYVCGEETIGGDFVARVWKNGVGTTLTAQGHIGGASAIFVSGNDVYAGGIDYFNNGEYPVIWKNGVATILPNNNENQSINSLYVQGNDVYAGGGSLLNAKIWKNGTVISTYFFGSTTTTMILSGTDLYVAGYSTPGIGNPYPGNSAGVWKNGVFTLLPANYPHNCTAEGMFIR